MIPTISNVQRVGLAQDLVRVLTVDLYNNVSCAGSKPLHLARGVRFVGATPCAWYVTHTDAERFGWL